MGLYGNNTRYTGGAIRNAELVPQYFPGWTLRLYTLTSSVPKDILSRLRELGAEIIPMDNHKMLGGKIGGMFWRFLVADDPSVDAFIVRDSDSRMSMRDKQAVDEWLASDKLVHIMRDHLQHGHHINGGMWGAKRGAFNFSFAEAIQRWPNRNIYWEDMAFLRDVVWRRVQGIQMSHDSFFCKKFPDSKPFPTRRFYSEHVGSVYSGDDSPMSGVDLSKESPMECRGHPSWRFG